MDISEKLRGNSPNALKLALFSLQKFIRVRYKSSLLSVQLKSSPGTRIRSSIPQS